MLLSTRGIVLHYTKYAESSIISHIYTEEFGKQSFMVNGVRSKKNKGKSIFLQPLTLVDIEVYHSPKKTIHRIKDFKVNAPFFKVPFEPIRRSLAFFMAELLFKCLAEDDKPQDHLFDFLHHSISLLDSDMEGVENYHLFFMLKLTAPLGFYPNFKDLSEGKYFDMSSGGFTNMEPSHGNYLNVWQTELLKKLHSISVEQLGQITLRGAGRAEFLEKILEYYKLHFQGLYEIKSLAILKQLFG